jgi:hypothetical protein
MLKIYQTSRFGPLWAHFKYFLTFRAIFSTRVYRFFAWKDAYSLNFDLRATMPWRPPLSYWVRQPILQSVCGILPSVYLRNQVIFCSLSFEDLPVLPLKWSVQRDGVENSTIKWQMYVIALYFFNDLRHDSQFHLCLLKARTWQSAITDLIVFAGVSYRSVICSIHAYVCKHLPALHNSSAWQRRDSSFY